MEKFQFKIWFIVPLIIFIFGAILGLFLVYSEISESYLHVENHAILDAKNRGDFLSLEVEHHIRENHFHGAETAISRFGADPNLQIALLFDEKNRVLMGTRYEMKGRDLKDTPCISYLPDFNAARNTMSGMVKLSEDRKTVTAVYPILLGRLPGEVMPSRVGILLIHYDLSFLKSISYSNGLNRSYLYIAALSLFCAVIWLMFNKFLSRRIYELVNASSRIAKGDFSVRAGLKGADDLAHLSETFDKMAERIQSDTESLQSQFKQLSIIFDSFDAVVYVSDIDTNECIFMNKYGREIDWEKICWEAGKGAIVSKESLLKDGAIQSPFIYELKYAAAERWFQCIDRAIEWIDGRTVRLQIALDITNRKWIEDEFSKLYIAVEQSPATVVITDKNGTIEYVNPKFIEITGYTYREAKGQNPRVLKSGVHPQEFYKNLWDTILAGKTWRGEFCNKKKSGELYWESASISPIKDSKGAITNFIAVKEDITAHKNMEEALIRAKNLESLGYIASGIAHDFNNLLTVILGNISLSKEYIKPEDEIFDMLSKSEDTCMKAKELTAKLLTFSREGVSIKKVISIGRLLKEGVGLALNGSNIKCEFYISDDLYNVEADERQMNQVIQNIVINSREAMHEGGVIAVSADNTIVSKMVNLPLKEGNYVKISIKDQGVGIPKEYLDKIFDPYFSTKQMGVQKGMGLGLSLCYSIVKKHNGHITIESAIGAGTTVHIYLPTHKELKIDDLRLTNEEKSLNLQSSIKKRVLVMDDEEVVRDVAGKMLERIGYEPEFARDGAEAVEIYRKAMERERPFHAVIMDLTIPGGMGGKEAIKKLKEIDPGVKAVVSSGYSDDPIMSEFSEYGFMGAAAKPYKIVELKEILQKVIGAKT